jgi:hypothetical protein
LPCFAAFPRQEPVSAPYIKGRASRRLVIAANFCVFKAIEKIPAPITGPCSQLRSAHGHDAGKLQVSRRHPAPSANADKSKIAPETGPLTAPHRKWKSGLRRLIRLFPALDRSTQYQQGK